MNGLMMKYFVLTPHKDNAYGEASKRALKTYAASIFSENEDLAMDIVKWVAKLEEPIKLLNDQRIPKERRAKTPQRLKSTPSKKK